MRPLNLFLGISLFVLVSQGAPAQAATTYYALSHPAITLKAPSSTPLITITRVGQRLIAAGVHGAIVMSDDNGLSWRQATVPVDVTLTGLYFSSAHTGWAVGHYGVVLQTTDGGVTWTKLLDGLDVIQALNDAAGQAQAASPGAADTALKLRVATAFKTAGPSKPFLTVGACGGSVLVAGQQDMAMFMAVGSTAWQEWTSKISDPTFQNIYAILNDGSTTLLIGEEGLLMQSKSDCLNFAPLPHPFTATLFGGLVLRPGTVLVYGLDGGVYKSADDGMNWTTFPMPDEDIFVSAVVLESGQVLLGALSGRLYLGDVPANSFHRLALLAPFEVAAMAQAGNGNVVLVGNGGVNVIPLASLR